MACGTPGEVNPLPSSSTTGSATGTSSLHPIAEQHLQDRKVEQSVIAQALALNPEPDLQAAAAAGGFAQLALNDARAIADDGLGAQAVRNPSLNYITDFYACEKYMPETVRGRSLFMLEHVMSVSIDPVGRPRVSQKKFSPFGLTNAREDCQTKIGNLFLPVSNSTYVGGHMIGDQLGGFGGRANIVPQASQFNNSSWKRAENALKSCRVLGFQNTSMNVLVTYPDRTTIIPDNFYLYGTVHNKRTKLAFRYEYRFPNIANGGINGPEEALELRNNLRKFGCGQKGLGIVMDVTGSMGGLISSMQQAVVNYIAAQPEEEEVDTTYSVTAFRDDVTSLGLTNDRASVINTVNSLSASGGGDCPEESLGALAQSIRSFDAVPDFVNANKDLLLITDASSRDGDVNAVITAAQERGVRVNVLLTGNCSLATASTARSQGASGGQLSAQEISSTVALRRIAEETGGTYTFMPSGTVADYSQVIQTVLDDTEGFRDDRAPLTLAEAREFVSTVELYGEEQANDHDRRLLLVKLDNAGRLADHGNRTAAANQLDFVATYINGLQEARLLSPLDGEYLLSSLKAIQESLTATP